MRIRWIRVSSVALAIIAVNAFYAGSSNSLEVVNGFGQAVTSPTPRERDAVPEPASLLLLGAGLTVVGTMLRKRHTQPSNL